MNDQVTKTWKHWWLTKLETRVDSDQQKQKNTNGWAAPSGGAQSKIETMASNLQMSGHSVTPFFQQLGGETCKVPLQRSTGLYGWNRFNDLAKSWSNVNSNIKRNFQTETMTITGCYIRFLHQRLESNICFQPSKHQLPWWSRSHQEATHNAGNHSRHYASWNLIMDHFPLFFWHLILLTSSNRPGLKAQNVARLDHQGG